MLPAIRGRRYYADHGGALLAGSACPQPSREFRLAPLVFVKDVLQENSDKLASPGRAGERDPVVGLLCTYTCCFVFVFFCFAEGASHAFVEDHGLHYTCLGFEDDDDDARCLSMISLLSFPLSFSLSVYPSVSFLCRLLPFSSILVYSVSVSTYVCACVSFILQGSLTGAQEGTS